MNKKGPISSWDVQKRVVRRVSTSLICLLSHTILSPTDFLTSFFVRSKKKESYTELLDQIAQASAQKITPGSNENVFVCVVYGTKVSFFMTYDVQLVEPNYRGLVPLYPMEKGKESLERDMGGIVHVSDLNDIFACEFDLLNEQCHGYLHACFIVMSRSGVLLTLKNKGRTCQNKWNVWVS